jgi:hypothetical protein
MKYFVVFAVHCLFLSLSVLGQAPNAFNYQAVVRSSTGISLVNRPVRFQIGIQQGNSGPVVYQEEHADTTNGDGLVVLQIGRGTLINNSLAFSSITWGSHSYYINIAIDTVGNSSFVNMGSFELLSVPYALYSSNGMPSGTQAGQMLQWNGTSWVAITSGNQNQVLTFCDNRPVWTLTGQCPGTITGINCGGASPSGQLYESQPSSITVSIPYTGGNGGLHSGQSITSTGITGLTATAASGSFVNGNDSIVYVLSGAPSGTGNADFAINIGGQNCSLSLFVNPIGSIASLNCVGATHNGGLIQDVAASGVSSTISYTGGNAGFYGAQSFSSTGVSGLTASISSGAFASGSGSVTFTISGTPVGSGTASFAISIGGQSCTLTRTVNPSTVSTLSCATASNNGTLTWNIAASGVNSSIPYTGGNGGGYGAQSINSTGVTGLTASISAGSFVNGNGSLVFTITGTPNGSGNANFAISMGGQSCSLTRSVGVGTVSGVTCGTTNNGTLVGGVSASGVSSVVSYTGGNGGGHNGQTVTSTGITGLTATLTSGTFLSGSGTLTYAITGTPSGLGTANFAISIGGRTCTLSRTVVGGSISTISCGTATTNGTLVHPVAASGVNSVIPYTGGNGGMHSGQTVTSTGVTGLTATLSSGSFASGNGNLTYTITGTPSAAGTASFAINIGGQTCALTRTVVAGAVSTLTCGTTNNGSLFASVAASGVSSVVSFTGGNGGSHSGQTVTSTGVTGLTATLSAGNFASGNGTLTYTITGTPSGTGTASFAISIGGRTCTLTRSVITGTITNLWCPACCTGICFQMDPCPTIAGTLVVATAASGVTSSIPYTGGNGGPFAAHSVTSTGVTGLTATRSAGNFVVGSGSLNYTITGTPSSTGTASFAISAGGQSCTFTREVRGPIESLTCPGMHVPFIGMHCIRTVTFTVSYTGGNGSAYPAQNYTEGGMTISLPAGNYAVGAGSVTFTATGMATGTNSYQWPISLGGLTCTWQPFPTSCP